MLQVLDELSELVYIADPETYEMLYMNRAGKDMFHIEGTYGGKCYQVLQGRETPCEFCTNCQLKEGVFYSWETTNPVLGRHFLLKDKLIRYHGKKVRVEIAFDMTEQVERRKTIQEALEVQNLVTECAKRLYEADRNPAALDDVLRMAGEYLQSDRVYIFEFEGSRMSNTHEWCAGGVQAQIENLQDMPVTLINRWLGPFREQNANLIEDMEEIREVSPQEYSILKAQDIHSLVTVPLLISGELIGYLGADNFAARKKKNTMEFLKAIGYFISSMLRQQRTLALLEKLSYYDDLTGIRNRNAFEKELREVSRLAAGVVYLNVNGMKQINDSKGHKFGDQVLRRTAEAVASFLGRENCYRVGSDEFVAIWKGVPKQEFTAKVTGLKNHFAYHEEYTVSIGTCWTSRRGKMRDIVHEANENMFLEKKAYYRGSALSGRYRSQTDDMLGITDPAALQKMLAAGQFQVFYQPQADIRTRKLNGAEALVRFRDEKGKLYTPDQFIPLLEEARLISKVDFYVFEHVCAQQKRWQEAGKNTVPISTNFSRHTLAVEGFAGRLQEICRQYGISQELMTVEITETVEADDRMLFYSAMEQLGKKKFRIAIDDFGVNNANLSLLTEVDFDVLKIDKSVIDHIGENEKTGLLMGALIQICHKLDIRVTAEGVELQEQLERLGAVGCDTVQGYLYARPVPEEEFESQFLNQAE